MCGLVSFFSTVVSLAFLYFPLLCFGCFFSDMLCMWIFVIVSHFLQLVFFLSVCSIDLVWACVFTECIWRKMSCWCCVRAENWIWSFFFSPSSLFCSWLIFTLCLCSLFDRTSREDFNAFIIGCLYCFIFVQSLSFSRCMYLRFSSNNQLIICNSTNVLL